MNYSPLRYPGGKTSLYDFLKKTLKSNQIYDGIYIEPFAGGAGAALKLLMLEDVYQIYLNDKDEFIYKFWYSILYHTKEFIQLVENCKLDIDEWNYRKSILSNTKLREGLSDVEIGFTAFYLNRCNRSGILKAGVIGGKEQNGKWKLDARFNKQELMDRIKKISLYKDRIKLFNLDAIDFLQKVKTNNVNIKNTLLYIDPPYVEQGEGLYNKFYSENDHINLARFLQKETPYNWLVSYDDNPTIHRIYKEVNKNIFEFNYFANKTKIGKELIIYSKNCKISDSYFHYSKSKIITSPSIENIAV